MSERTRMKRVDVHLGKREYVVVWQEDARQCWIEPEEPLTLTAARKEAREFHRVNPELPVTVYQLVRPVAGGPGDTT